MKKLLFYAFPLFIFACKPNVQVTKITGKRIEIESTLVSDQQIENFVTPYREKLEKNMKKPLSEAPFNFVKNDGELQSTLGNLLADLSYEMANPIFKKKTGEDIDFVLMNHGGLRAPIPKGTVTTENAFLLMPFENELVVTKLSGKKVKNLFNYFVQRKSAHPLSKQVKLEIIGDNYSLKIKDKSFDENQSYYVLTTDYLQTGGDGMTFFANPEELILLDYKARQSIIDYFTKAKTLEASLDNRVIIKK